MENNFQFTSATISDRGLSEKRPQNEDSYIELKPYGVFAVADGVGGAQAGDVASQMAVEIIGEAFINIAPDADPEETMKIAIERANEAIFQMSHDLPQLSSMATTIVALHVAREIATIGHVGDSRLYRVDGTGQLFRETQDHSVVEEEVRAGRMTPEQAVNHPSRNVISRALGAENSVDIDMKMMIVHPGTTFLLCSDGITRHIEDWELAALLASGSEPDEICRQMKDICYSRGAEDNLTAVIVRFAAEAVDEEDAEISSSDYELEQVTVAAARPAPENSVEFDDLGKESQEISTHDLVLEEESRIEDNDDQSYLLEDASEIFGDETAAQDFTDYSSSSVIVPAQEAPAETEVPVYSTVDDYRVESDGGRNFGSRALSAIAWLIVGGLLGISVSYYLLQSTPVVVEPLPQLIDNSSEIAPSRFEEGRRIVDKDPAKYLNAQAASAQDAEDYFLLGRAFLLTGKYWEAKRSFNLAKDRLSLVDASNAKTLAAEIAMALTIIDTPGASDAFTKQIAISNPNQNANTAPGNSQPIR